MKGVGGCAVFFAAKQLFRLFLQPGPYGAVVTFEEVEDAGW